MKNKKFTAVILAAGMGSRLKHLTKNVPKPLIEIAGKTLIAHAIEWSKKLGASKIVIVGGYHYEILKEAVYKIDSSVVFVRNDEYATSQRMESLLCAASEIEGGLYICDADYVFDSGLADLIKGNFRGMSIFGVGKDAKGVGLDMMMKTDGKGNLVTMSKELTEFDAYFCTQVYFDTEFVTMLLSAGRDLIHEHGDKMVHVEDALLRLVEKGEKIRFVDVGESRFVEIDTLDEFEMAKKLVVPADNGVRVNSL